MFDLQKPKAVSLKDRRGSTQTKRRIAIFTGNYNHNPDGVSLTLNRLVHHLEEHENAEVMIFGPTTKNPPMKHAGRFFSIASFQAPGRPDYRISLGLSSGAQAALEEFEPTLFHIATPDYLGFQALKLAQEWDIPVVGSYHTHFSSYLKYYNLEPFEGFLWKYLRWFYKQCQHVYVPSHSMAAVLRSHKITRGLRLWQRGVDTNRFSPKHRSIRWRRRQGIKDEEILITFVSRLVWEKGLDVYAEVIEELQARDIPHQSMIVGNGPAREELKRRLPDTLFTGYLSGQELSRAYASSDIFLFPSDTETFGNVTLEAMASGVPAVCADATGSDALVEQGITGFLAQPGDTESFLDYVIHLIERPGLRYRMGEAARREAQQYDWHAIMSQLASYYNEILTPDEAINERNISASSSDLVTASVS